MVEAKRLVNDMRLRLNVHHQDGDWLLVSRVEVHLEIIIIQCLYSANSRIADRCAAQEIY